MGPLGSYRSAAQGMALLTDIANLQVATAGTIVARVPPDFDFREGSSDWHHLRLFRSCSNVDSCCTGPATAARMEVHVAVRLSEAVGLYPGEVVHHLAYGWAEGDHVANCCLGFYFERSAAGHLSNSWAVL